MAGIETHHRLGPNTPLFRQGSGPLMSAREVKAALDAYQLYLDEPLLVATPVKGTISSRDVVTWLRSGCPEEDLAHRIRRDLWVPNALSRTPNQMKAQESTARSASASVPAAHSQGLITPPKHSQTAIPPSTAAPNQLPARYVNRLGVQLRRLALNPLTWIVAWAVYCGLGFAAEMFVQNDPEPTTWGIISAAGPALLVGALLIVGALITVVVLTVDGRSVVWLIVVSGAVGYVTAVMATHSYGLAYSHFLSNQLAPVSTLIDVCMRHGFRYEPHREGAVCNDGWKSGATGQGACSYHGGVDHWIHPGKQTRTLEECRQEAEAISWL
jgi:hypothetical protein